MKYFDPRKMGFPLDAPEVVEAKMRSLEEKRARDFAMFLDSLERKRA